MLSESAVIKIKQENNVNNFPVLLKVKRPVKKGANIE
jgi:hypothetical protein